MKIAIVGAGPAGCHLAHLLADTEHEILLFDHRVPYEKPCGGGLSPLVGRRFPDVMALPFPRHRPPCLVLRSSDGGEVEQELNSLDWAIVSRAELGGALLERALGNGRVRLLRQRVKDMERVGERWLLGTAAGETFSAEYLVGADGARSLVRRQVVGSIPRQYLALGVGYLVRGAPDVIIFQTYAEVEGYLWSFPRTDHASVGIATRLGTMPPQELWLRVDRFLAETYPEANKVKRWAGLLPMAQDASLWETPCAGPGWTLLGDAAGHVHPLTGEGIAYALWSADLLADAFQRNDPESYQDLWQEEYGTGLTAASAMLSSVSSSHATYEMAFQLSMMMAFSDLGE